MKRQVITIKLYDGDTLDQECLVSDKIPFAITKEIGRHNELRNRYHLTHIPSSTVIDASGIHCGFALLKNARRAISRLEELTEKHGWNWNFEPEIRTGSGGSRYAVAPDWLNQNLWAIYDALYQEE